MRDKGTYRQWRELCCQTWMLCIRCGGERKGGSRGECTKLRGVMKKKKGERTRGKKKRRKGRVVVVVYSPGNRFSRTLFLSVPGSASRLEWCHMKIALYVQTVISTSYWATLSSFNCHTTSPSSSCNHSSFIHIYSQPQRPSSFFTDD